MRQELAAAGFTEALNFALVKKKKKKHNSQQQTNMNWLCRSVLFLFFCTTVSYLILSLSSILFLFLKPLFLAS